MDAAQLRQAISDRSDLVIIGITPIWRFLLRHIPHSHQVWRTELFEKGSSLLLDAAGFSRWAQQKGITAKSQVVVWDERYDATWLWWAFRHYGKNDVHILDGGLQAWRTAGFKLAQGPGLLGRTQNAGDFIARPSDQFPIATLNHVFQARLENAAQLWDTRDRSEWQGRKRLRGAGRAGRIPWSRHLPWQLFRNLGHHNSTFRSDAEIKHVIQVHGLNPSKQQIFYCQSGIRTTTAIYALSRIGWDPRHLYNYCGSWREWSNQSQLPTTQEHQSWRDIVKRMFQRIKRHLKHQQRDRRRPDA